MVGAAAVVGGPGESKAGAGVFAFFALLGLMGALGAYLNLRHVDQFLLILTPEGMVERHFWAPGRDVDWIVFADVQTMQVTRMRPPALIVTYRDGHSERLALDLLSLFGPPSEIGASIVAAFTRSSHPEDPVPD